MLPHKKQEKGRVFDVHASGEESGTSFRTLKDRVLGKNVLNLRKNFRGRHPWIWIGGAFALLLILFISVRQLSSKAEVKDFYPSTCLGEWQKPENAEGRPDTLGAASTSFSEDNSAVYSSGTQIFCGGFLNKDSEPSGTISSVGLTLVWQVGDAPYVPPEAQPVSAEVASSTSSSSTEDGVATSTEASSTDATSTVTTSSTTSIASSTDENTSTPTTQSTTTDEIASSTSAEPTPTPTSTPTPAPSPTSTPDPTPTPSPDPTPNPAPSPAPTPTPTPDPTPVPAPAPAPASLPNPAPAPTPAPPSALKWIVPIAYADEETSTDTIVGTTTDTVTTTVIELNPPVKVELAPVTTTTETAPTTTASSSDLSASTTLPTTTLPVILPEPPAPDQNFLQISYSLDGKLWIDLQKVDLTNWPNLTIKLPLTNWADIESLQVRVQGIATTQQKISPVYLDGMLLEVAFTGGSGLKPPPPAFLTDKSTYLQGEPIHAVGVPFKSYIEIYALDNPDSPNIPTNVTSYQVPTDDGVDIDSNVLAPGHYVLVGTLEPSGCGAFSLDECEKRNTFISDTSILVLPPQ